VCAIVGLVAAQGSPVTNMFITSALQSLAHRGPDSSGACEANVDQMHVALGHRRLAILGLGEAGSQPMSYKHLTISFNGEIYNYQSLCRDVLNEDPNSLRNDTDLILRMWDSLGSECVSLFRGIFAFALFDSSTRRLFLVRDTYGVKPLYFRFDNESLRFASEPWVLLNKTDSVPIDQGSCSNYLLRAHYDNSRETFFKDIKNLSPGTITSFSIADKSINVEENTRYAKEFRARTTESFQRCCFKVRELFLQAVERNLTSDVPVAFALSGGLDSAAIVCTARHLFPDRPLSVFSYVPENENLSEFHFVKLLEQTHNLEVYPCSLNHSDVESVLAAFVRAQGEPVQSSRQLAQFVVFQAAAKEGFRVLLEGQGGDEVLAGYHGFVHLRLIDLVAAGHVRDAITLLKKWSKSNSSYSIPLVLSMMGSELLSRFQIPVQVEGLIRARLTGDNALWILNKYAKDDSNHTRRSERFRLWRDWGDSRFAAGLREARTSDYLPQLLRQGDRNAMAHSVENRVPFLDEDFTAYVGTLPDEYLLSKDGKSKYVFREAMRGLVPDAIIDRTDKVGFQADGGLLPPATTVARVWTEVVPWLQGADEILSEAALWRRRSMQHWLEWLEQMQEHELLTSQ